MYDNCITRTANNDGVKCFCIVSCLWIVGWPLKWALGYDDDHSLTAYFRRASIFRALFALAVCVGACVRM